MSDPPAPKRRRVAPQQGHLSPPVLKGPSPSLPTLLAQTTQILSTLDEVGATLGTQRQHVALLHGKLAILWAGGTRLNERAIDVCSMLSGYLSDGALVPWVESVHAAVVGESKMVEGHSAAVSIEGAVADLDVFSVLPSVVVNHIMAFLPMYMLSRMAQVCKRFSAIARHHGRRHLPLRDVSVLSAKDFGNVARHRPYRVDILELSRSDAPLEGLEQLRTLRVMEWSACTDYQLGAVGRLPNLTLLNLSYCDGVTDAGLAHLTGMSTLVSIDLTGCKQVSTLSHLAVLTQLRALDLTWDDKVDPEGIRPLTALAALRTLSLKGCDQLHDLSLAQTLTALTGLRALDVQWCATGVTDRLLERVTPALTALTRLDLRRCDNLTDDGVSLLRPLEHLQWLCVGDVGLNDTGLTSIAALTTLTTLSLSGCVHITDAGLQALQPLRLLKDLSLACCPQLASAGLQCLRPLKALTALDLNQCPRMSDTGMMHLACLTSLRTLKLRASHVTADGLWPFTALRQLRELDLRGTTITDDAEELIELQSQVVTLSVVQLAPVEPDAESEALLIDDGEGHESLPEDAENSGGEDQPGVGGIDTMSNVAAQAAEVLDAEGLTMESLLSQSVETDTTILQAVNEWHDAFDLEEEEEEDFGPN